MFLIDTNIVSQLVRRPEGDVATRVAGLEEGSFATSVIVAAELRYGTERRASQRLADHMETILAAIDILPLEKDVARHYGQIRNQLERAGRPIGQNDLLIAAHARAFGVTLVTNNTREFLRVPGLSVEDW